MLKKNGDMSHLRHETTLGNVLQNSLNLFRALTLDALFRGVRNEAPAQLIQKMIAIVLEIITTFNAPLLILLLHVVSTAQLLRHFASH